MYIKQTWTNGDLITANKLNHIELGIEENQLPEITTADIGKYLIGIPDFENPESSEEVCPQQTVTIVDNGVELTHYNTSQLYSNAILTVGNSQYVWVSNGSYLCTFSGEDVYDYGLNFDERQIKWYFVAFDSNGDPLPGTYTVSVVWVVPGVKWGLGYPPYSGGGVDIPIPIPSV